MSTDYLAKYIVGWKVNFEDVYNPVTKYNQDTGEPYTVSQFSHRDAYINGILICRVDGDPDQIWKCPDKVVNTHYIGGDVFLGICLKVDVYDNTRFKNVTEVDMPDQLVQLIDRFGECDTYFGLDVC